MITTIYIGFVILFLCGSFLIYMNFDAYQVWHSYNRNAHGHGLNIVSPEWRYFDWIFNDPEPYSVFVGMDLIR